MSNGGSIPSRKGSLGSMSRRRASRLKTSGSKLNFGDATDDVHVCIMCLRAIMNHQVSRMIKCTERAGGLASQGSSLITLLLFMYYELNVYYLVIQFRVETTKKQENAMVLL